MSILQRYESWAFSTVVSCFQALLQTRWLPRCAVTKTSPTASTESPPTERQSWTSSRPCQSAKYTKTIPQTTTFKLLIQNCSCDCNGVVNIVGLCLMCKCEELRINIKNISSLVFLQVSGIGKVSEKMLSSLGITSCAHLGQQMALLSLMFSETAWHHFMRISLGLGSTHMERWHALQLISALITTLNPRTKSIMCSGHASMASTWWHGLYAIYMLHACISMLYDIEPMP